MIDRHTVVALVLLAGTAGAQIRLAADPEIATLLGSVSKERIEADVRTLVLFGTRHSLSLTDDPKRGIGAARNWIKAEFEAIAATSDGRMQVRFDEHHVPPGARVPKGAAITNVVATLTGTDPDRSVIISGHYDSRATDPLDATSDAPGANDDASGTAVVLEAARVLAKTTPRATIVFLAVAGEEQALLGAAGYAAAARKADVRIDAMVTNDIVGGVVGSSGRRENSRVRLFSEGIPSGPMDARGRPERTVVGSDNDAPSRQLARYLELRGETYVPGFDVTLIFRQDRFLRGGDHKAFNEQGYAAVRFTEVHENYDFQHQDVKVVNGHRFGDLPENLDYDYVARVAKVNIAGIAELALAPAPLRQVRMVVSRLTHETELRWAAPKEKDIAGYAVLLRRTHEPTWTERITVQPEETSVILKDHSKDDWNFAVECVDAKGRASLPVYPIPSQR